MSFQSFRPSLILFLFSVFLIAGASQLHAQSEPGPDADWVAPHLVGPDLTPPTLLPGVSMTAEQTRQSVQWLTDQLMLHVPRTIEGDDDWGETKKVWAGVKLHREKWELKTSRRWRELRHGRWVRYEITLPPPALPTDQHEAQWDDANSTPSDGPRGHVVEIHNVTAVTSPDGDRRWKVDTSLETPAAFAVRAERWNLGAKWYSVEITGTMNLRLQTTLTMALQADFSEVPPAMELDVEIENASLAVTNLEVRRISKLGRDIAEEIGSLAEKTIGKVWIRKENARLTDRLNKAIGDNRKSLRWSMADWLAQLAQ